MYSPHIISLMNCHRGTWRLTVLPQVMLQAMEGRGVLQRGGREATDAVLYIPDFSGFLPPAEYAALEDPAGFWTLQAEGESAGRSSFFVRGTLSAPLSLQQARDTLDTVCVVTGWSLHDYGSPGMRHIEVISKISTRYDTES